jgi:protein-S-isoprenylcysteine O-methyltransferase Ste14
VVWHIENSSAVAAVTVVSFVGWLIVLTSTFLINHFELFGLHQGANNLTGRPMPAPRFRAPLYYKFVRHPIYLGFIIAFCDGNFAHRDRLFAAMHESLPWHETDLCLSQSNPNISVMQPA